MYQVAIPMQDICIRMSCSGNFKSVHSPAFELSIVYSQMWHGRLVPQVRFDTVFCQVTDNFPVQNIYKKMEVSDIYLIVYAEYSDLIYNHVYDCIQKITIDLYCWTNLSYIDWIGYTKPLSSPTGGLI